MACRSFALSVSNLVCFTGCPAASAAAFSLSRASLPFLLRPILTLGHAVFAAMEQVDLIEIFPVAHLHDFGFEVFHRSVRTAVLTPGAGICRSVHVGQQGDFLDPQGIDNDVDMNIAAVVVSVRMGADNGLMTGKMLPAQNSSPNACAQSTVKPLSARVPWVKGNDIVVAFHIFPLLIFAVAEIGAHTGNGKIFFAAVQRGYSVVLPRA